MSLPDLPYLSIPDLVARWQKWGATPQTIWICLKKDQLHIDHLPDGSHVYNQGQAGDFFFRRELPGTTLGITYDYEYLTGDEKFLEVWIRTSPLDNDKATKKKRPQYNFKTFPAFINIEAIKRFEAEHLSSTLTPEIKADIFKRQEEQELLVEELKSKGYTNKQIALELKRLYPNIVASRIGRLLQDDPNGNQSIEALRKQASRLLKK
jgi:hypothetical protein